jgi:hypothetical protein
MAAEHPKENNDASYRFLLPLESIDDEEIHSDTDTFYRKQKIRPESGMKSNPFSFFISFVPTFSFLIIYIKF